EGPPPAGRRRGRSVDPATRRRAAGAATLTDPRPCLGSETEARVWRSVDRANAVPRPAKPARQKLLTLGPSACAAPRTRRLQLRTHAPESLPRRLRRPRHAVGPVHWAALSLSVPDPRQGLGSVPPGHVGLTSRRGAATILPMDGSASFAPTLLLAMPQLRDPNFVRSVVLLCEHGAQGALGFVVNRPTEVRAVDAVVLDPPASGDSGLMLWAGGPVESQRGFLLLGDDPGVADSERVAEGFHLTASVDVLRRLLAAAPADTALRRARLLLGYAGWGPGQLDAELTASAWLTAPP